MEENHKPQKIDVSSERFVEHIYEVFGQYIDPYSRINFTQEGMACLPKDDFEAPSEVKSDDRWRSGEYTPDHISSDGELDDDDDEFDDDDDEKQVVLYPDSGATNNLIAYIETNFEVSHHDALELVAEMSASYHFNFDVAGFLLLLDAKLENHELEKKLAEATARFETFQNGIADLNAQMDGDIQARIHYPVELEGVKDNYLRNATLIAKALKVPADSEILYVIESGSKKIEITREPASLEKGARIIEAQRVLDQHFGAGRSRK